jgi:signal transduction histidine kinase
MDRNLKWIHIIAVLFLLAAVGAKTFVYLQKPLQNPSIEKMESVLNEAVQRFDENVSRLKSVNQNLNRNIEELIQRSGPLTRNMRQQIEGSLIKPVALYSNDSLLIWDGNLPEVLNIPSDIEPGVVLLNYDSNIFLRSVSQGNNSTLIHYKLLVRPLTSEDNQEAVYVPNNWSSTLDYPVQYRWNSVRVQSPDLSRKVEIDGNEVGVVEINHAGYNVRDYKYQRLKEAIDTKILITLSSVFFLWIWLNTLHVSHGRQFVIRLGSLIILGSLLYVANFGVRIAGFLTYIGIPVQQQMAIQITDLVAKSVILFAGIVIVIRATWIHKRYFGITWYPRTIVISVFSGFLFVVFFLFVTINYLELASSDAIRLFDSSLIPDIETYLYTIGFATMVGSLIMLGVYTSQYIHASEQDQLSWVLPLMLIGFIPGAWLMLRGAPDTFGADVQAFLIVLGILPLLGGLLYFKQRERLQFVSRIRLITLGSLVLSFILFPLVNLVWQNHQMSEIVSSTELLVDEVAEYNELRPDKNNATASVNFPIYRVAPGDFHVSVYDADTGKRLQVWNRTVGVDVQSMELKKNEELNDKSEAEIRKVYSGDQPFQLIRFYQADHNIVVKIAVPSPTLSTYIFGISRVFFALLITYLVFYVFSRFILREHLFLFDSRERLQSRILDSFVLATMLFLAVLIVASSFFINQKQEQSAEEIAQTIAFEISERLATELNFEISDPVLRYLSERYNASVEVYDGHLQYRPDENSKKVMQAGTMLSYDVFEKMVDDKEVQLIRQQSDSDVIKTIVYQQMPGQALLGNRLLLKIQRSENRSALDENLIETISSLISLYVIMFSIFIIAAFFISRYLTQPLHQLLHGLKRISSGHLDTLISVKTQDEIGELANAYNFMIFRLQDLQQELAEAEREAAWTEMARQVAHEIKNPLTPMRLSVQHLQQKISKNDSSDEELSVSVNKVAATLIEQIDSLKNIATDFSRFAQPVNRNPEILDINDVMESISELYMHDYHCTLFVEPSSVDLKVMAVEDELKRLFINLIKNSMEAMPNGGIIHLSAFEYKNEIFVEVTDNGSGIPLDLQKNIFQPNFSTKTSGTGIGLAISKKIVESHNGTIICASVPGSGTTFTIAMPSAN